MRYFYCSLDLHRCIIMTGFKHVKCLLTFTYFEGHCFVCRLSLKPVDEFALNLHTLALFVLYIWMDG